MSNEWYENKQISKDRAEVFKAADRCIYCSEGKQPFTKEHVIPRGMGGGMIFPRASCETCRKIIHEVETYCMRGPFLSHRLKVGLVNNLSDLGSTLKMPIIVDGKRHDKSIPIESYPNFLVLPQFHDVPGIISGRLNRTGRISYSIWGNEEELRALNEQGNAILVENFNIDKFARALAKIAHGAMAGKYGLDNFQPLLPEYILGKAPHLGDALIGNWGEDGMTRIPNLLHQVGNGFVQDGARVRIDARIRLFASYEKTPVYRVIVGYLTKPIDEVLAPLGRRVIPQET